MSVRLEHEVAVASTSLAAFPDLQSENDGILGALAAHRLHVSIQEWGDRDVDWKRFAVVLVRTTWDYPQRLPEFLNWLDDLDQSGAQVLNPTQLIRWNYRKTYLLDLEEAGVPIVPISLVQSGRTVTAPSSQIVVKPVIGVGSAGVFRLGADQSHVVEVDSLVSPFIRSIHDGEMSVFVIGGDAVLSVLKVPSATDWRVQPQYGGTYKVVSSDPAASLVAANAALAVRTAAGLDEIPAYLRVDLLRSSYGWLVLEVEAIEPSLYCAQSPAAVNQLASLVRQRMGLA